MNTTQEILPVVASAVVLGAGTALLLALMAAAVLLALEELGLRRLANVLSIWSWLIDRSAALREEAPTWVWCVLMVIRPRKMMAKLKPNHADDKLRRRTQELWKKVGRSEEPPAHSAAEDGRAAPGHSRTLVPFWKVIGGAVSLPARQLLGVLSTSIQGDVANRKPSHFVCWIAAIGSLPIDPSPFADLSPIDKPPVDEPPTKGATPAVVPFDSEADARRDSIHTVVQRNADRALDSLQIRLAGGWSVTRYAISLLLVVLMSTLLTTAPQAGARAALSIDGASIWQAAVGLTPNLALWIVAAAFVPIVLGPLERLSQRSR